MLLTLFAFLMKFVDISRTMRNQGRCDACNKGVYCWQHAAVSQHKATSSNSSSTSSGCDSNASSKENYYVGHQHQQQQHEQEQQQSLTQQQAQHHSLTPQQLQQMRYYEQLQRQQLQLLQQQLLQRRRLQQQLREQGVLVGGGTTGGNNRVNNKTTATLTCNQQYLVQQRLQQQQQQQGLALDNARNDNDILNNNNNNNYYNNVNNNNNNSNNNQFVGYGFVKGQKSRRGMTEFSTNNDINNKSHLSQPLQNSPRHHNFHQTHPHHQQNQNQNPNPNSPQHYANLNQHFTHTLKQHTPTHRNKSNQQTLPLNSSANTANAINNASSATSTTSSSPTSAAHSPLHYRNPLNSPNNSPFTYAYYGGGDQQQHGARNSSLAATAQQHLLQQHLRSSKLPLLTQTQYQQHLNDLLLQQQHLQQQQQQLLSAKDADDELSEESLKQNVAIVLNNLDRYNNALRSIILNEQVSSNSSVFYDDGLLDSSGVNNNFLYNNNCEQGNSYGNGGKMATAATPESDYNSNATTPGSRSNMMLPLDSNAQQQQQHLWFLDYGYRDGCGGLQRSVLSSLSASYNCIGDLIYYEDLAKNLDANLAEVDMESFRAEDIHSLLSQLPSYCKSLGGGNGRLQPSLMLQHPLLPSAAQQAAHNMMSQTSQTSSTNELIDNSICKSELLFSPVKESHISVDSLDMDAYPDDGDIILTCKANKDNYTIAFEGSVLYSDESFYEPNEVALKNKQNFINLHSNLEDIVKRKALEVSMSRSEQAFTARNKLQKSNTTQLQRYPSGNNNTTDIPVPVRHAPHCLVRKSNSLPNLRDSLEVGVNCHDQQLDQQQQLQQQQPLNVSQAVSTSTVDCCRSRNLLPMCQMPISCNSISASISDNVTQQQQQNAQQRHKHRCCCTTSNLNAVAGSAAAANHSHNASANAATQAKHISDSASSGNSNPPAFSLVKRFIKQKSSNCSFEDQVSAHTCMDVSSGCWPSSDAAGSSSSSSLEQRLRKKSMNDSGKGSALSRHDEEELLHGSACGGSCAFQADNGAEHAATTAKKHLRPRSDANFYDEDRSSSSGGSITAVNSPAHRRRSIPLRNPQLCQLQLHDAHNSSGSLQSSDASRSNSEQLTQVYLASGTTEASTAVVGASLESKKLRRTELCRTTSTSSHNSEMITRSMQTSCGSLSTRSSLSDRFRFVPPSFLAKLNNLGEETQAPIYVIYPNYALPDLGFVKTNTSADVIFSPFNYKMAVGGTCTSTSTSTASLKKRCSVSGNEDEILKTMDYKHVVDWQSLATLLPVEYRRRLKHIPEVGGLLHALDSELAQRPLFCMSPPIRRNRPHICDCAAYFLQQQQTQTQAQTQLPTGGEEGSSSSGSSQQPSSGYRGSSTLLTDSELDNADPLKQMYVYQYEQQRMDSGVELSPASAKTPPQPMPRGILRKAASQSRNKRNSMIEEQQQTKLSKLEKRRSLQEPPYHHGVGSSEELCDVFEEESELFVLPQPRKERLSRKDMDARARAENFLSSLPRSELRYYAEIASILESESSEPHVQYDAAALKKEVSRALSQQKKVSFNDAEAQQLQQQFMHPEARQQRFSTPPNSPNHSIAGNGLRMPSAPNAVPRRCSQADMHAKKVAVAALDEKEQRKIESNRFKRLQIQWELMSKDSSMLKELANVQQTHSGGSTPTSAAAAAAAAAHKSRIPRPVSYPAGKISTQDAGKGTRSPSRIVPPKRYSMAASPVSTTAQTTATSPATPNTPTGTRARTPTSRVAVTAPNTPKRRVQSPRTIPRVR